jgi:uncharacterized protein
MKADTSQLSAPLAVAAAALLVTLDLLLTLALLGHLPTAWLFAEVAGAPLWAVLLVGFAAQLVDGALGMAFGLVSTTFLLGLGVPPALASASVHVAEIGTTGASALAHWRAGNVDRRLWWRLVLPGAAGALAGVALLATLDGAALKPFVAAYLVLAALWLLWRAAWRWQHHRQQRSPHRSAPVAAVAGGFLDAVGGGGWGPVVTGTLMQHSHDPRRVIGTVNAAEFVLAVLTGTTLALAVGLTHWSLIAALAAGGLVAAPLGPLLAARLPQRLLLAAVGVLLLVVSLLTLLR